MAIEYVSIALNADIGDPTAKLVLISLSNYADEQGRCWPTQGTLARHAGASRRTIIRKLEWLRERGLVEVEGQKTPDGLKKCNRYRIIYGAVAKLAPTAGGDGDKLAQRSDRVSPSMCQSGTLDVTEPCHSRCDTAVSQQVNRHEEPSKNPPLIPPIAGKANIEAEAVKAWNDLASRCSLPLVQKLTDQRRRHLRRRLDQVGGIEGWRLALGKVERNRWMHGDNDQHWKASFDFLLQESSLQKLIEGNYDDKAGDDKPDDPDRSIKLIAPLWQRIFDRHGKPYVPSPPQHDVERAFHLRLISLDCALANSGDRTRILARVCQHSDCSDPALESLRGVRYCAQHRFWAHKKVSSDLEAAE